MCKVYNCEFTSLHYIPIMPCVLLSTPEGDYILDKPIGKP